MLKHDILITYDVETVTKEGEKRLRRVLKTCKNFGQRVQDSVFECCLSDSQIEDAREQLLAIMDLKKDSLKMYFLHLGRDHSVHSYGVEKFKDLDGPLVI